jgi:uncharacterized protein (UPF0332 family)
MSGAREAAEEAHLLFDAGHYRGACSRAYYAMFNAARALLDARGYAPERTKTHKSVLQLFSREFVGAGAFDRDDGRALRRAADARQLADYGDGVSRDQASTVMSALDRFISAATGSLPTTGEVKR